MASRSQQSKREGNPHPLAIVAADLEVSQIDAFKSLGTGTLRGASPPKTIVDDDKWHTIFITIWNQILTPRLIGSRSMETFLEQRS